MPGQFTELLLTTIEGLGLRDTTAPSSTPPQEAPVIPPFLAHPAASRARLSAMPAATSRNRANHWRGIANPAPALQLLKLLLVPTRRFEGASQLGPGLARPLF
jgi:hypothetical protein